MAAINICSLLRGDPGCRLAFTRALPTRRAFLTHPLRRRALARARCAWHAKTHVKRLTANSKSTCFALAHKLAAVTAMPQLKYVYFPGNLRVQCVCLLDRLRDPLPHAACTDCHCAQQCFLTWEASQNTMLSGYAADSYLGSMLTLYVTGYGIPLCHGFPLWDNRALRIRCLWWRGSFCPC